MTNRKDGNNKEKNNPNETDLSDLACTYLLLCNKIARCYLNLSFDLLC